MDPHTTGVDGHRISLQVTQDAAETPCAECGKRNGGKRYAHARTCSLYVPHPASVAAANLPAGEVILYH